MHSQTSFVDAVQSPQLHVRPRRTFPTPETAGGGPAYVAAWCDWRDAYAEPAAALRCERDRAEERSLAGAMAGLCLGWFVAGPAGGLCGLLAGAWFGAR